MAYDGTPGDLREWLEAVDKLDELQHVDGADWYLEIGAISELNYRRTPPAALLFDDIKGYRRGLRVLTGSVSSARRLGMTLRLGDDLDDASLVATLRGRPNQWESQAADHEPQVVASGPVTENVVAGRDVNLLDLPAPRWHDLDAGRYVGTGCAVITSDPETGVVNVGAYRMQIQDEGRSATVNPIPGKHGAQHIAAWFEREGRAPVAVSLGHDPLFLVLAGTEVPTGMSELAYAGAVAGRAVPVIHGEVTGLPIPAHAELAVEGWVRPDDTRPEGPFGEWTGYYSGSEHPVLNLAIERLYHRTDPILLGAPPGKPPHDYSYMRTVMKSAMVLDALVKAGIPGISGVWAHEAGGGRLLLVVSIEQRYCGHSRQAAYVAAQCQAAAYMNRYVIVVDDDVDPMDLNDVVWAMCTRSDPGVDIEIMRRTWGSKADPLLVDQSVPYNSRAVIDACVPFERREEFPRVACSDRAELGAVARTWERLFSDPRFPLPASAWGAAPARGAGRSTPTPAEDLM